MEPAQQHIQKLIDINALPQAILLSGDDHSVLRSLARTIAERLLATDNLESHPDFIYTQSTKVEEIRRLLGALFLKSFGNRVIILDRAENLTPEAVNNLLKKIEEPNTNTYFIVTSVHEESLLPTLRSRLMAFRLFAPDAVTASEPVMQFVQASDLASRLKAAVALAEDSDSAIDALKNIYRHESASINARSPQRLMALLKAFEYASANVGLSRVFSFLALRW
jgi:DNA polymerase III delta prime subunit